MPPPCFQRPWRSISCVGAPFWAMRLAMPTRPLWPLKNSQSARPAALELRPSPAGRSGTPTARTPSAHHATPAGRMASSAAHGGGGDGHRTAPWASDVGLGANHGDAAASRRPQRCTSPQVSAAASLNAATPRQRATATRARSKLSTLGCCLRWAFRMPRPRLHGVERSGEPDDGEHVGGEGAGLTLGPGQTGVCPNPSTPRARPGPGRENRGFGPFVYFGDGGGGQAQGGNTGAGSRRGRPGSGPR